MSATPEKVKKQVRKMLDELIRIELADGVGCAMATLFIVFTGSLRAYTNKVGDEKFIQTFNKWLADLGYEVTRIKQ